MNFVYYFVDNTGKIIYVGKTSNLKRRIKEHFTRGHLPKECYIKIEKIFAAEVNESKYDTEICETLLIDKYKPVYNKEKKFNEKYERTNYNLLDLNFKEIFYNFEKNDISYKPIEYNCYAEIGIQNKAKALINYNLSILSRKEYFNYITNDILNDDTLKMLVDIHNLAMKNIIESACNIDKSIKENDDPYDTFVAFDGNILNNNNFINTNVIKLYQSNFLLKITDEIYGIPLLRNKLLNFIAQN